MKKEKIKKILEKNSKMIEEKIDQGTWSASYDKRADMFFLGERIIPEGTFYVSLDDNSSILIRIDKNDIVYGYAIENARFFVKENPEIRIPMYFVMYPKRMRAILSVAKLINKMKAARDTSAVSNYIQKFA